MDSLVLTAFLLAAAYVGFVVGILLAIRIQRGHGRGGPPPPPPGPPSPSDFDLWESELERNSVA